MDLKSGMILIPPDIKNFSCMHPRYNGYSFIYHIGFIETTEALLILILTLGIVGANAIIIFVINNRRYISNIPQQPRYLLTSLALNDLVIGLLITPFGLIPALFKCWPYGEIFCQIQALLRGALSQQSAVILICMAIDRYMYALHPRRYEKHSSKKGCVAILSLTWIMNLTIFGLLVLPKGYYFNNTGLMACEPFYSKPSYRILATCALYFPTTMVLMYCYGLSFHLSRFRLVVANSSIPTVAATSQTSLNTTIKKMTLEERHLSASTSRSMAAISLGFIVMVTPWTIQEIVTACTGSKLPSFLDFLVTWTALSNSFWNPFLYWLLNSHFRRLCKILLSIQWCPHQEISHHKGHCCNMNSECDPPIPTLPFPSQSHAQQQHSHSIQRLAADSNVGAAPYYLTMHPDIDELSEKYWGEILERTLSSGSLYNLQKSFISSHQQHKPCKKHEKQHSIDFDKISEMNTRRIQCEKHGIGGIVVGNGGGSGSGGGGGIVDSDDLNSDNNDDNEDMNDDDEEDDDDCFNENRQQHHQQHQQQQHHHQQKHHQKLRSSILNPELKFREHIYHDVNCAKNKRTRGCNTNRVEDPL